MKRPLYITATLFCVFLLSSTAQAVITTTGDVDPTDPAWFYVGKDSDGTLIIDNGSKVQTGNSYLGYNAGSTGIATVTGNGSRWTNDCSLYVGFDGNGQLDIADSAVVISYFVNIGYDTGSTGEVNVSGSNSALASAGGLCVGEEDAGILNITDGASVSCGSGSIGRESGSTGSVTVSGTGSTWSNYDWLLIGYRGSGELNLLDGGAMTVSGYTMLGGEIGTGSIHFDNGTMTTGGLFAATSDLTGTGTIYTNGIVSDVDLLFDATHGLGKTIHLDSLPDQDITIHYSQNIAGALGVGYKNSATLTITDGVQIRSETGYLGYHAGSSGIATISGGGTGWDCEIGISIGREGYGELNLVDGAYLQTDRIFISETYRSKGVLNVSDSYCFCGDSIEVSGTGELNIINGGYVFSHEAEINGGKVKISGVDSQWQIIGDLEFDASADDSSLDIENGGVLLVWGTLGPSGGYSIAGPTSFINMSTGGMLALKGEADDSLDTFLARIDGPEAIRWWDDSINDWAMISTATRNVDYTLEYRAEKPLSGYTVLTVGVSVPEPTTLVLLLTLLTTVGFIRRLPPRSKKHCQK